MLLLVRYEILGLPFNTLTANYEYCSSNTDILPLPFQMQLSEKLKTFSASFYWIFGICIKFSTFWKKKETHSPSISEVIESQKRVFLNAWKVLFLKRFWQWKYWRVFKTAEICRKGPLSNFFIILSQIELENVTFSQIWDFRTVCWHLDCQLQVFL